MWLVSTRAIAGNLPVRLKVGVYLVGRKENCQVRIDEPTISRHHARLTCSTDCLIVRDLGSRNGTFVNAARVKEEEQAELGDEVRFGAIRCLLAGSPLAAPGIQESMSTQRYPSGNIPTVDLEGLTPAQREVLSLLMKGLDEKKIAASSGRSPGTVHTHLKAIYQHFQVHSRPELILKLVQGGS